MTHISTSMYVYRPVARHPGGGGGLNLDGWNTIYRVWLGCLYHGRNKESRAPIAVDG